MPFSTQHTPTHPYKVPTKYITDSGLLIEALESVMGRNNYVVVVQNNAYNITSPTAQSADLQRVVRHYGALHKQRVGSKLKPQGRGVAAARQGSHPQKRAPVGA